MTVANTGPSRVGLSRVGLSRVGIVGGTFDPPHHGHLAVALEVHDRLRLDRTLLVVANDPWQKSAQGPVTAARTRLDLVRAMVAGIDGLEASDLEIARGGESYMAETLATLRAEEPESELFLVVGSDAAAGLDSWKRPDEVRALATTVVVERAGRSGGRPPASWPHLVVDVPSLEISSSDIRSRFADGRPVEALVPSAVIETVRASGAYGSGR